VKSTIFSKALELVALIFQKIPWQLHLKWAHTNISVYSKYNTLCLK